MAEDKDRIGLRLYNTIIIFDVYMVAKSPEAARASLLSMIGAVGDQAVPPTEVVAKEVTMPNSIRQSWLNEKPYIGADITDEEFETLKGTTTGEMWLRLYTKAPKK